MVVTGECGHQLQSWLYLLNSVFFTPLIYTYIFKNICTLILVMSQLNMWLYKEIVIFVWLLQCVNLYSIFPRWMFNFVIQLLHVKSVNDIVLLVLIGNTLVCRYSVQSQVWYLKNPLNLVYILPSNTFWCKFK